MGGGRRSGEHQQNRGEPSHRRHGLIIKTAANWFRMTRAKITPLPTPSQAMKFFARPPWGSDHSSGASRRMAPNDTNVPDIAISAITTERIAVTGVGPAQA